MTKEIPLPNPLSDSYLYWHKLNNIKARIEDVMSEISKNSQLDDDDIAESMAEDILLGHLQPIGEDFEILVQQLRDFLD